MQRILVIGCPGGGKSAFARLLGEALNIPVYHLDKYFWKENWTPTPQSAFRDTQNQLMNGERWILEGNFKKSIDNRIQKADTIIVFDFPKFINLWRTLKRFFQHFGRVRPDMGGGNIESLQWKHLKYIITYPRERFLADVRALAKGKSLIILRSPKDATRYLADIRAHTS